MIWKNKKILKAKQIDELREKHMTTYRKIDKKEKLLKKMKSVIEDLLE
jgi:hypothetical protein